MNISNKGKEFIKSFEGLRLKAYKCIESEKYYTIGYGHYGKDVTKDMTITKVQADQLFDNDIKKYVDGVNKAKLGFLPNQNQFDALVSFAFNLGVGILEDFKGMTSKEVSEEMLLYVNSGGILLEGLVRRRKEEVKLFNTPVATDEKEIKRYKEVGTFYPNDKIYFRNNPKVSIDNPIQGYYTKGEKVNYDLVVITNYYVYISWTNKDNVRRYMPIREVINGVPQEMWGYIE